MKLTEEQIRAVVDTHLRRVEERKQDGDRMDARGNPHTYLTQARIELKLNGLWMTVDEQPYRTLQPEYDRYVEALVGLVRAALDLERAEPVAPSKGNTAWERLENALKEEDPDAEAHS